MMHEDRTSWKTTRLYSTYNYCSLTTPAEGNGGTVTFCALAPFQRWPETLASCFLGRLCLEKNTTLIWIATLYVMSLTQSSLCKHSVPSKGRPLIHFLLMDVWRKRNRMDNSVNWEITSSTSLIFDSINFWQNVFPVPRIFFMEWLRGMQSKMQMIFI